MKRQTICHIKINFKYCDERKKRKLHKKTTKKTPRFNFLFKLFLIILVFSINVNFFGLES
jgi:hypothetical protein